MRLKQERALSTLIGKPLKLVNQCTYLDSNISSTESNVNIHLLKVWTAIDKSSIIWKSHLFNKIKRDFFQVVAVPVLLNRCTTWTQLSLVVWPRLGVPFTSQNSREFCEFCSPERILSCAYTICSHGQISVSCTVHNGSPSPPSRVYSYTLRANLPYSLII